MNDKGQMHTLEGLAAAVLVITTVMFITRATVVVTPQIELALDAQLKQYSNDALTIVDSEPVGMNLTKYVAAWNGIEANISLQVPDGMMDLDNDLSAIMPDNIAYNVDFVYWNNSLKTTHVIVHGVPPDNSITASRLVTLHSTDLKSSYWNGTGITDLNPRVVEVRLISWYI